MSVCVRVSEGERAVAPLSLHTAREREREKERERACVRERETESKRERESSRTPSLREPPMVR